MRNFDKKYFIHQLLSFCGHNPYISDKFTEFSVWFLLEIKTKTSQNSLYSSAFFKILKKPALVQKPTIPHMKALILSYLELEGWGRGITMGAPRPPPVKLFAIFLSEVVEAKRVEKNKTIFD